MTPSLPTLSIASAMISPTVVSAAEIDAVAAICSLVSTSLAMPSSCSATASTARLDAALEAHRVGAGGDVAQALADHRLGEHGRGRRTVTGDVVGLLRDLLDELGADLLVGVLELDLLGDGHTVVGDRGGAPLLLEDDVAALGAERDLDRVGEGVHTLLQPAAGLLVESNQLRHNCCDSFRESGGRRGGLPATDGPTGAGEPCSPTGRGPQRHRVMMLSLSWYECQPHV